MGLEVLAIAGMAAAVGGGAMSAYSQYSAGQAQKNAADYQAQLDDTRAGMAESQGYIQQRQSDIQFGNTLARAQTGVASNGLVLGQGSAADYNISAAQQHAIEKDIIGRNAGMQEWGYNANASLERYQGKNAARSGDFGAIGSMMSSLGSAASIGASSGMFDGQAPTLATSVPDYQSGNWASPSLAPGSYGNR